MDYRVAKPNAAVQHTEKRKVRGIVGHCTCTTGFSCVKAGKRNQ